MIKRTLIFSNPFYLSKKNNQLVYSSPDDKSEIKKNENINSVPIEDIGIIILDNPQITITHSLLSALIENNSAVVTCNSAHMPSGLFLNLDSNQIQNEIFRSQINSSEPLKKQLWQQTISSKIKNQALLLRKNNISVDNMLLWSKKVRSGDPDNFEGRAAAFYWKKIFPMFNNFIRDQFGDPPNNLLNYGYAILRSITARSLVASGLLPTLGIHHANKYNAYCLADDIMEPYRPFVDQIVLTIITNGEDFYELSPSIKKQLLNLPVIDVFIDNQKSPLMIAMQRTTSSLAKCFQGSSRKILFPTILVN